MIKTDKMIKTGNDYYSRVSECYHIVHRTALTVAA